MNHPSSTPDTTATPDPLTAAKTATDLSSPDVSVAAEPKPSYVKLAMRNMVRKRGTSLKHFVLTTLGLVGVLVGLAYLTR